MPFYTSGFTTTVYEKKLQIKKKIFFVSKTRLFLFYLFKILVIAKNMFYLHVMSTRGAIL